MINFKNYTARFETSLTASSGCGVAQKVEVGGPSHQVIYRERMSPGCRNVNVLFADDDPFVRRFLTTALTMEGYRIFQADDGYAAMSLWHEHQPIGLIIADVNMPGLDGPLLAEAIWVEKFTPVLYISGRPPEGLTARHIKEGRAGFLAKPFQLAELRQSIQAIADFGPEEK
jgi:CheY-like chemotaxis protein